MKRSGAARCIIVSRVIQLRSVLLLLLLPFRLVVSTVFHPVPLLFTSASSFKVAYRTLIRRVAVGSRV